MLIVCTTIDDDALARRLADELVQRRLAACVQVTGPMTSVYRWRDGVEQATEWLLTAKTTEAAWPELERAVAELHPYETPELVATRVEHASAAYAAWVDGAVGGEA